MKTGLYGILILTILISFLGLVRCNDCAVGCFDIYVKCLDRIHTGGRCRAEERQCISSTCKVSKAEQICIDKCDKTFQNCPKNHIQDCFAAERACYQDC